MSSTDLYTIQNRKFASMEFGQLESCPSANLQLIFFQKINLMVSIHGERMEDVVKNTNYQMESQHNVILRQMEFKKDLVALHLDTVEIPYGIALNFEP